MNIKPVNSFKLLQAFSFMIALVLVFGALGLPVQAAPTGERLRNLAGPFLVGYASRNDFWSMSDAVQYQDVARTEFNFLTPENAMKWDATEGTQNVFTFSQADQHVSFAQTNAMKIHGHTLVWHSQLPGWVSGISGATNLTNVMYNHIDGVMNHWTDGTIYAWDVVNEAFNEDGTRRSSPFQNIIGNSYIELAFQRARAADPLAKLIYNDYNVETVNSKSTAMYNMVSDFKSRGIPIDGVGLQMHLTNGGMDYNSFASNMARFAALGVEVYITEMDVRFPTPLSQTDLQTQATIYGNVLNRCLAQPACKALQVWGIPDKYSWVPSVFPGQGGALIFDDNYNAKPAYYALQSELTANPRATATPCISCTPTPTRTIPPTPTKTNTAPPPSNTPTPCVNCTLKVQYKNGENPALPSDNQVKPHIQILNTGTGSIALNTLKARYWFTRDTAQPQTFYCDFAVVGCGTIMQAMVQMGTPVTGADFYLEVGFSSGTLNAGGNTGEIQNRFNKNDWSNYNENDDWSFGANTTYADAPHVTLYQSGSLVWGAEPGGVGPTNTPVPTNTSTNTPVATNTPTNTPVATNTPTPTSTTCACPTNTPTNTPVASNTPTNTPVASNTPTNTPVATNTPTNTPIGPTPTPGGNLCATPTVITGGGSYAIPASGVCFKYVNAAFVRGAMWSVMNGSDSTVSNVLKWYGGRTETVTACINDSQTLNGNGAQLNNFTVAKDSANAMYVTITTNKVNTVSMTIQNWQNGSGCSVAPTPQP
jgi:endo-1,4-beta-xylanase